MEMSRKCCAGCESFNLAILSNPRNACSYVCVLVRCVVLRQFRDLKPRVMHVHMYSYVASRRTMIVIRFMIRPGTTIGMLT